MKKLILSLLMACTVIATTSLLAEACTRILYETADGKFIVARSMDWYDPIGTDLWAFPRGMKRDGGVGPNSIEWTSKYGSVVADMYGLASVDGMNEAGLVANTLYLAESDYGDAESSRKPLLSVGAWAQYILDNFATVAEAVEALEKEPFTIVNPDLPRGVKAGGHISIADRTGDSAIFEYLEGKLVIHHGRKYTVMTNSPPFDEQLALNKYWGEEVDGIHMLPGTHRPSDRFARASWNLNATPKESDRKVAVATAFSMIRHISVPLGITDPEKPNIASTQWRTVVDIDAGRFYFDPADSPAVFWVDIEKLSLSPEDKPTKLDIGESPVLAGEVSDKFVPAEPFKFLSH